MFTHPSVSIIPFPFYANARFQNCSPRYSVPWFQNIDSTAEELLDPGVQTNF